MDEIKCHSLCHFCMQNTKIAQIALLITSSPSEVVDS